MMKFSLLLWTGANLLLATVHFCGADIGHSQVALWTGVIVLLAVAIEHSAEMMLTHEARVQQIRDGRWKWSARAAGQWRTRRGIAWGREGAHDQVERIWGCRPEAIDRKKK